MNKTVVDLLIAHNEQQQEATHEYMKLRFLEFCHLFAKYDSSFKSKLNQKINYTSPKIQNKLIEIIATVMKEEISQKIHKSGMFSIIVNEAQCFKEEQMFIVLHYPENLYPREKLIGFVNCSKARDSTSFAVAITDVLNNLHVEGMVMVAQLYGGASVMSSKHNGVQAKIKEQHPQATYIHCMAHRVNLVITDTCSHIQMAIGFFNIIESLYIYYSKSSTRSKFLEVQK
ncbi:hypothetical protein PR048_020831 [Dryococelus australis]|uniref:DUF4371 domain-containing protein n=1 Tax=Dryococelus australis TaxID=614101 RepID=A0ABQ9GWH3_9NEOP|nr:hypothetical protein PR048_020831 [Dryococelus australis]